MAARATLHSLTFLLGIVSSAILAPGQNQIVTAGPSRDNAGLQSVAPGEILTLFTTGLNVADAIATQTPLPTSLSGVSVQARVFGAANTAGYPAVLPILSVHSYNVTSFYGSPCPTGSNVPIVCSSTQVTVEIPTEGVCAPSPAAAPEKPANCSGPPPFPVYNVPPLLVLNVIANGLTGPDMPLTVVASYGHPLNSCDPIFQPQAASCYDLVTHADGSLVSANGASPAHVGETISVYAVGLGTGSGFVVPSGYAPGAPIQMFGTSSAVASSRRDEFSATLTLISGRPLLPRVKS